MNSINDFCLYAPAEPNSVIGVVEGEAVAYCVDGSRYGTRTIPPGAITGLLVVKTPSYIAIAANLNGQRLNIAANDEGGEMDPHGADLRGKCVSRLSRISDWQPDRLADVEQPIRLEQRLEQRIAQRLEQRIALSGHRVASVHRQFIVRRALVASV